MALFLSIPGKSVRETAPAAAVGQLAANLLLLC
jgi:hypothetical protein